MPKQIPLLPDLTDATLTARLQHLIDHKTKPLGSLGKPAATIAKTSPSVSSPVQAPVKSVSLNWGWPANGKLLQRFSSEGVGSKGLDISGNRGDPVKAAAEGVVVYAGEGLVGYGKLMIVRHNDDFISAYAHNDRLISAEGQRVKQGQTIAELGSRWRAWQTCRPKAPPPRRG